MIKSSISKFRIPLVTCQFSTMSASPVTKPKVIIVTGPTAVGKTNVSLDLAERLGGEIISADSVQVYKGLDIGSDKIPLADRRGIPHHLLDIINPEEEFSAGDFYELARKATEDILSRGKVPIVVGGTGFYLRWFMYGKPDTMSSTKETEAAANTRLEQAWTAAAEKLQRELTPEEKWEAGVGVLEELGDIETAARVRNEVNNYYRLHRMVEILMHSDGKTLAELNVNEMKPLDYDFRPYFLFRPREELYRRIDGRVEEMVEGGLLGECWQLLHKHGIPPNSNCATKAIGYRQAMEFLQQQQTKNQTITDDAVIGLVKDIQAASRQFCRRQFHWFRDNSAFLWIDAARDRQQVVDDIIQSFNSEGSHKGSTQPGNFGRLGKAEEKEMKQYISKLQKYVKGGSVVKKTMEDVEALLLKYNNGGDSVE